MKVKKLNDYINNPFRNYRKRCTLKGASTLLTVGNFLNMREVYSIKHIADEFNTTPSQIYKALRLIGFQYNRVGKRWDNYSGKNFRDVYDTPLVLKK